MGGGKNRRFFEKYIPLYLINILFFLLLNRCNVSIGNINHSPRFIVQYLKLVDDILIEDTALWLNKQKDRSISITLDIGTCAGITLLAVLYICGREVRLANVVATASKKETKLAEMCFEALTINDKIT